MKTTKYFNFRSKKPDRENIKIEWIEFVLKSHIRRKVQNDGRIKMWAKIEEASNKYLRVITLDDGETVHNAFFDRGFEENES